MGKYLVLQAWLVSLLISLPPLVAPQIFDQVNSRDALSHHF